MFDENNPFFQIENDDDIDNPGFVTLMTQDEENEISKQEFPSELPILPSVIKPSTALSQSPLIALQI